VLVGQRFGPAVGLPADAACPANIVE